MSQIIVNFRGRAEFDSEDPALTSLLRSTGYTLEKFLDDPEMVIDYICTVGSETVNLDIPTDEVDIDMICEDEE